ncbi:MAG TPA: hypothetical protein VK694_02230 [Verrucomicrobiae bacterium]|nr:hypothetical protein [Verrucomicrobiae bacterium]
MAEPVPHSLTPPEALTLRVDSLDTQQGIGGGDLDNEANRTAESILGAHMPAYDHYVGAARDFVADKLGMTDVSSVDRTAVLPAETAEAWGVGSSGGHYLPELEVAYVFEQSSGRPKTDKLILASSLVHELAHSATVTPENARSENPFYHEALAGMAEYFALQNLAEAGEFDPAPDTTVTRTVGGEDITIVVPGSFRRVDASEVKDGQADSTQALIAAMVVGMGLKINGQSAKELLGLARRGDNAAYDAMRNAMASIDPTLVEDILQTSGSTDEIIKVAHKAQKIVEMI